MGRLWGWGGRYPMQRGVSELIIYFDLTLAYSTITLLAIAPHSHVSFLTHTHTEKLQPQVACGSEGAGQEGGRRHSIVMLHAGLGGRGGEDEALN